MDLCRLGKHKWKVVVGGKHGSVKECTVCHTVKTRSTLKA